MGLLGAVSVLLCCSLASTQTLDPDGRNVCQNLRDPSSLVCCTGWKQEGKECTIPVCEGKQACQKDELCVYPGVCRCPPGFYGAHCKTRCPSDFWAPDCREVCQCHPHGRCHPLTGECTCNANRWGPLCQYACKCTRHGRCHPVHGNCTCDEGWWSPTCAKPCQCFNGGALSATCDQLTGGCQCHIGHWGQKCSLSCNCYMSQCNQRTGTCDCQQGWWGPTCDRRCNCDLTHSRCDPLNGQCLCLPGYKGVFCNQPCEDGKYDSGCKMSCGYCKDGQPCSPVDGLCADCEPGWHGPRCDRPCPLDYYGEGCLKKCPKCKRGDTCDPRTGDCWKCNPGWAGPRCEEICSDMTYGDACRFLCGPCFHGNCHHVTGRCVCRPGFQGESCNSSCPASQYGLNCSSACDCGEGVSCDPATGACLNSGRGAILAGVLVPVFMLLLAVLCCCLCCGEGPTDGKDRVDDGGTSVRMKHHVYNVLANISASLPCASAWSSGLPRVTVSHHDPELTFNHSFIEPPSCGWVTEGSSFESDEEEGEALYCVPPREDIPAVAGGEFQEMSSKCNMFLDPSGFSCEDMSLPFAIPRTSSIAKSKRPSVSFAEGTRFSSKERCGSAQDLGAPPGPPRTKPKSPWGVLMISALQGSAARSTEEGGVEGVVSEEEDVDDGKGGDNHELSEAADHEANRYSAIPCRATPQVPGAAGRRRTMSNTAARKGAQVPASAPEGGHTAEPAPDKITTVYVTVGKAGKPISKVEATSEGPVQAMLRRLGSIQRQKDQETSKPKAKVAEGITKPPRRKLGARASVWEEGGPSGEVIMRKPSRKKHSSANVNSTVGANDSPPSEDGVPKRPLSILKSVPEVTLADTVSQVTAVAAEIESGSSEIEHNESRHLTIKPGTDGESLSEVITNEGVMTSMNDEPSYENVMIKHL